jgi:hypothetical protein
VKLLNARVWANGAVVSPDGRGKHANRPNRIPDDVVARIDSHIKSFPRQTSHYTLNASPDKYLSADLSVRRMHHLYLIKFEPHIMSADEGDEEGDDAKADAADNGNDQQKPQVTYGTFTASFRFVAH